MPQKNWFKNFYEHQPLIIMVLCFSLLGVGIVSVTAMVNHMDIPTWIGSWHTKQITAIQLQQGELKPVILIDVRSPEEYAEDRIGESMLVPLTNIGAGFGIKQIFAIVPMKSQHQIQPTVVLYCRSGPRSIKAYQQLENTGLNLVVLKGGIKAWREVVPKSNEAAILASIILNSQV